MLHAPVLFCWSCCAALAALLMGGCSSAQVYYATDPLLEKQAVQVRAWLKPQALQVEASAGPYPVAQVTLLTAGGQEIPPAISVRQPSRVDQRGVRIGVGTGIGRGRVIGGVGTTVPLEKQKILPGPREARWLNPPMDQRPFSVRVVLETDPPLVVDVPMN